MAEGVVAQNEILLIFFTFCLSACPGSRSDGIKLPLNYLRSNSVKTAI